MLVFAIIVCLMTFAAVCAQFGRDLMMLQQNSYRDDRYSRWLEEAHESTAYDRLFGWIVLLLSLVPMVGMRLGIMLIALFSLWNFIRLASKKYKKPLVFTNRVRRIYFTSIAVALAGYGVLQFWLHGMEKLYGASVYLVFIYTVSIVVVRLANWLLKPVEASINKKYYNEAASILRSMPNLTVIGVTGSYGKTSTKHFLYRILSEKYDVLMTPGNFNTTLGVVRTIREHMKPYNEIFIAEMGAKQKNDIKEICDLVHPTYGIVTAVGPMHLESFGSIENVQATKFELVDALPADGLAIVNNDFEYITNREVANVECVRYAVAPERPADFHAADIKYAANGTEFAIRDANGEVLRLHTRLVGECNISNLIAAVILALRLGVEKDKIRYAVDKIEQVEHRLDMKRLPNGITIIDDAYNSNPVGSKMALDVLSHMTDGQRFVITPGMIELGDDQYRLNEKLGEHIAQSADVAIIVGEYNRDAILAGLQKGGMNESNIHATATFNEAQKLMLSLARRGDTVLYENDLPDTFK